MSRFTVHTARFSVLVATLLVVGTAASDTWAAKGGGGTIYFMNGAGLPCNYTWSMNSDGSAVAQLGFWGYLTYPSRNLHNGHRWFLSVRGISGDRYPDGTGPTAVFAYRDDCNQGVTLQLMNDPTLQPAVYYWYGIQWLPGDRGISFKARRWTDGQPTEGGLYTADLAWDEYGNIVGLTDPTVALEFDLGSDGWPTFYSHSWDPVGNRVVYIDSVVGGLWVADLVAGTRTQIVTGGQVDSPDWSPDGTKIVFGSGVTIYTVTPTGAGLKRVISPTYVKNVYWRGFGRPYFSPGGDFIVCVGWNDESNNDVFRATSSGRSLTNLTGTGSLNEIATGWR